MAKADKTAKKKTVPQGGYVVKKGDSLNSIAKKLGVPAYELAQRNNIKYPSVPSVGTVLK